MGDNHTHGELALTRNQALVFDTLHKAAAPMSAYSILDMLRDDGLRAPLQVYRALEKLVELGMVHRLESLNAFVACQHPTCDTHEATAFAICQKCGHVEELSEGSLDETLHGLAAGAGYTLSTATVELRGICAQCSAA